MITASLSTVAWRRPALERMLPTILPQVDRLDVFLQGYDAAPDCLVREPRVHIAEGRYHPQWLALKSCAKLFWVAQGLVDDGYHFTVDDDIAYPADYVSYCISKIERYQRRALVGFHGALYNAEVNHIYRDRTEWHYEKGCSGDVGVHTIGTGTLAWHTSALRLTPQDIQGWDSVDFTVAIAAQKQRVPMVCISRPASYLKSLPLADDPRACSGLDSYLERMLGFYRSHANWQTFAADAVRRPVAVIMPCYREQPDRIMRSVESALATPGVDLVRIVDDCSPEPVVLPRCDRLEVVRRSVNGGPSAAMNTGIRTLSDDAIICRLDVGDLYYPEPKGREIDLVKSGKHRAVFSWHYDPVRHFTRTVDKGWERGLYQDNQFAATTGVFEKGVWAEVGGFDDTKRWTDDWCIAMKIQHLIGWHQFAEVTGEHGMFPGGHSDVSADPAKKAARDKDMAHTVRLARALGNPGHYAHLFNPKWCKKRGIEPLKMPAKRA